MSTPDQQSPRKDETPRESLLYGTENTDRVLPGHTYDGIKEYDNPMPGWWVWLFVLTIAVSAVYYVGITFFDFVDTYEDDLAESLEDLEVMRQAYAEANPQFEADEATLQAFVENAEAPVLEAGAQHYATYCAACHGDQGQGLIGPNLTDAYWVHGGSNMDVFNVISTGIADKGMPAWSDVLSPEERAELVAYVQSLEGTDPPNAKAPEGDLYEE